MLESIYSNEHGEGKDSNRVHTSYRMPKNIRQVGKTNANRKIYVEDYVMTYIKQLVGEDYSKCQLAVLVGQYSKVEDCHNIFIYGAVKMDHVEIDNEINITNETWTSIYENIKKYFPEAEIVGWYIGGPGYLLEGRDKIRKAHIDNFAGQDKTLLTYDNMEKEETFFIYENSSLQKQTGYYIYYEKNEEMQTYMIDHKKKISDEGTYDDRVSKEIRTVIQNKKPVVEESKGVTKLVYAAGTLMAIVVLVVAATMLNNYEQMRLFENTLNVLNENIKSIETSATNNGEKPTGNPSKENEPTNEPTKEPTNGPVQGEELANEENLNVEVVHGNVEPLEENQQEDNRSEGETSGQEEEEQPEVEEEEDPDLQEVEAEVNDDIKFYTVLYGDTLASISFKLYDSGNYISVIKELNGIQDENKIFEGQKLIVP